MVRFLSCYNSSYGAVWWPDGYCSLSCGDLERKGGRRQDVKLNIILKVVDFFPNRKRTELAVFGAYFILALTALTLL
jgi:hypothetical protein